MGSGHFQIEKAKTSMLNAQTHTECRHGLLAPVRWYSTELIVASYHGAAETCHMHEQTQHQSVS